MLNPQPQPPDIELRQAVNPRRREGDALAVIRSAVHLLDSKIVAIHGLRKELTEERRLWISLRGQLRTGRWGHYKGKNITKHRRDVDERIHDTADLAALNLDSEFYKMPGVHRAIYKELYDEPEAQRLANWKNYLAMLLAHSRGMHEKTILSGLSTIAVRDAHFAKLPPEMQEQIKQDYPKSYSSTTLDYSTPVW